MTRFRSSVFWRLVRGGLWGFVLVACGNAGAGNEPPRSAQPPQMTDTSEEPSASSQLTAPFEDTVPSQGTVPSEGKGVVQWCSAAGAPLVGAPVLDDQERAYLVTSDGYLHAFERDGRYRWSYTVRGTPLGSVSLRPSDGAVLLGTTASMVYAITQQGSLYFAFGTLAPVWSGLFALNDDTVVYLGHDRRLYALGTTGAARYRVRAPGEPMGGPVVAENDLVWLPLSDGVARFESARKLDKIPHSSPVEEVVALSNRAVSRAGGKAFALQGVEAPRLLGEARFLSGGVDEIALTSEGGVTTFFDSSLLPTSEKASVSLELSASPALSPSRVWYPTSEGVLVVKERGAEGVVRVDLGKGPLSTPVLGKSGSWGLVPTVGGEFCAVSLEGVRP